MKEKLVAYLYDFTAGSSWDDDKVPEQVRALFTAACFIGDIDADTKEADYILQTLYQSVPEESITYDAFQDFMLELIV